MGIFALIVAAASTPFLLISAASYVGSIGYGVLPAPTFPSSNIPPSLTPPLSAQGVTWTNVTITYPYPFLAATITFLDWLSQYASVVLLVLMVPVLVVSRSSNNRTELISAYSIVAFLFLFSTLGHELLRYYLIPSWALTYACSRTRTTAILAILGGLLTMVSPFGQFQLVLALATLLAIAASTSPAKNYPLATPPLMANMRFFGDERKTSSAYSVPGRKTSWTMTMKGRKRKAIGT